MHQILPITVFHQVPWMPPPWQHCPHRDCQKIFFLIPWLSLGLGGPRRPVTLRMKQGSLWPQKWGNSFYSHGAWAPTWGGQDQIGLKADWKSMMLLSSEPCSTRACCHDMFIKCCVYSRAPLPDWLWVKVPARIKCYPISEMQLRSPALASSHRFQTIPTGKNRMLWYAK